MRAFSYLETVTLVEKKQKVPESAAACHCRWWSQCPTSCSFSSSLFLLLLQSPWILFLIYLLLRSLFLFCLSSYCSRNYPNSFSLSCFLPFLFLIVSFYLIFTLLSHFFLRSLFSSCFVRIVILLTAPLPTHPYTFLSPYSSSAFSDPFFLSSSPASFYFSSLSSNHIINYMYSSSQPSFSFLFVAFLPRLP